MCFYRDWYRKGVKRVSDFLNDDGSIVSKSDFEKRFNFNTNISCMRHNSIICAISKYVKDMNFSKNNYIKTVGPFIPFHYLEILLYKKSTKPIYNLVNSKKESIPSSICRWKLTTVQMGYQELPLHDVFKICFKVTTDSNVQWLQYRILHRLLLVKSYLKKNS